MRFAVGGIGKDGPEDRGLSERCIVGFNAGQPYEYACHEGNYGMLNIIRGARAQEAPAAEG